MKKLIYVIVIIFLVVGAGFINDDIRQYRNQSTAVKVSTINDLNGVATIFQRVNTLSSLGEGYEVYLVSQEVPVDDSYISNYDPENFKLKFPVDYAGVQYSISNFHISNTTGIEEKPNSTKTLYILVCAPAGYTTAQQVIEYENLHYHPSISPTFSIDVTDEAGTYTVFCQ